jgi:hypothetical protein
MLIGDARSAISVSRAAQHVLNVVLVIRRTPNLVSAVLPSLVHTHAYMHKCVYTY